MTWMYVSTTGEPLEAEESELTDLAQHGLLSPSTLVWHPGRPEWVPAAELKPEIFGASLPSAGLNLGRAVMEPLWQKRGWLLVLAGGLLGVAVLRAAVAAVAAWPDVPKLAGVALSLLTSVLVVGFLGRWWRRLGRAAATHGLQEAREAAQAGGQVLALCGAIGILLLLLAGYDLISLAARTLLKG